MTRVRTWACLTVAAILALLLERQAREAAWLDTDNMGAA